MTSHRYTDAEIRANIRKTISEITHLRPEQITDSASFQALGIDSLTAAEILVAVDHNYKIKIPQDEMGAIQHVNDAVAAVKRQMQ